MRCTGKALDMPYHHHEIPPNPSAHMEPCSPIPNIVSHCFTCPAQSVNFPNHNRTKCNPTNGREGQNSQTQHTGPPSPPRRPYPSSPPHHHHYPPPVHFCSDAPSVAATSPWLYDFESAPLGHGRAILLIRRGIGRARRRRSRRLILRARRGGARRRSVRRLCCGEGDGSQGRDGGVGYLDWLGCSEKRMRMRVVRTSSKRGWGRIGKT